MKYLLTADIHGNIEILKQILTIYEKEEAKKLVILGDLSASNFPDNEEIASLLNPMSSELEIIRGNCDNQMLEQRLDTEMYDTDNLYIGNQVITITHGNRYNMYHLPPYCRKYFCARAYACAISCQAKRYDSSKSRVSHLSTWDEYAMLFNHY